MLFVLERSRPAISYHQLKTGFLEQVAKYFSLFFCVKPCLILASWNSPVKVRWDISHALCSCLENQTMMIILTPFQKYESANATKIEFLFRYFWASVDQYLDLKAAKICFFFPSNSKGHLLENGPSRSSSQSPIRVSVVFSLDTCSSSEVYLWFYC